MTITDKKVKLVNLQLIATIGFIIALLISFSLTYDKKQSLENKKRLYKNEEAQNLALFQIILVFLVSILFLYITYKQYEISKTYHEKDENDLLLQTKTATLSVIAAIIGLYIITKNYKNNNLSISQIEII